MSSFSNPHHLYLFAMRNGKQKLAYGGSPEEAYANLQLRLTEKEMREILPDQFTRIPQRELRQHVHNLG
jgi:hypothetical protein